MRDEAFLILIQPVSFTLDVYVESLNKLYNADEKLANIGFKNPKHHIGEQPIHLVSSSFDDGPQSRHISLLVKDIPYRLEPSFFEEILQHENFAALKNITINAEKSFLSLYIVDQSVFTFSLQVCVQTPVGKNDVQYNDIILGFRELINTNNGIYENIKSTILAHTKKTLTSIGVTPSNESIYIPEHTAHIFSYFTQHYNHEQANAINAVHAAEEGIDFERYKLPETTADYFVRFGWSYTSLYAVSQFEAEKCLQISIHLSARWFFWRKFNSTTYENLKEITFDTVHIQSLDSMLNGHNTLVAISRVLSAKDFQFISTLKPWQENIYSKTQAYWKVPSLREETLLTLDTVKGVIERKMEQYSQKLQQKQSSILFLIASVEIFAIIGHLNDYLTVVTINNLPKSLHFLSFEGFNTFVTFIPLLLIIGFAVAMFYIADYSLSLVFNRKYRNLLKYFSNKE